MIIGPTSFASVSFGNHPVGINNAGDMIPLRDKRADIWHHHVAEETTKKVHFDFNIG
ncbi:hypothetical protein ACLB1E_06930 [Escherichia coli]